MQPVRFLNVAGSRIQPAMTQPSHLTPRRCRQVDCAMLSQQVFKEVAPHLVLSPPSTISLPPSALPTALISFVFSCLSSIMTSSSESTSIEELIAHKTVEDYGEFRYVASSPEPPAVRPWPRQRLNFAQHRHHSRLSHPLGGRPTRRLCRDRVRGPTLPDRKLVPR